MAAIREIVYTNIKYDRATLIGQYAQKRSYFLDRRDSASFSALGMQLNLLINGENPRAASKVEWARWQPLSSSTNDETLKIMDNAISEVGKRMDRMVALAEAATDEELDDYDRINMQIEICRLQYEIDCIARNKMHDGPDTIWTMTEPGTMTATILPTESFEDTKVYQMLERARERIVNGGKWDVAEIRNSIVKFNELGLKEVVRYEWATTNDETVPTVGNILKGKGRSVMDAESAAVSATELEKEIEGLQKKREKLAGFVTRELNGELDTEKEDDRELVKNFFSELHYFFSTLYREPYQIEAGRQYTEDGRDVTDVEPVSHIVNAKPVKASDLGMDFTPREEAGDWQEGDVVATDVTPPSDEPLEGVVFHPNEVPELAAQEEAQTQPSGPADNEEDAFSASIPQGDLQDDSEQAYHSNISLNGRFWYEHLQAIRTNSHGESEEEDDPKKQAL